jgi:hypothetical protein
MKIEERRVSYPRLQSPARRQVKIETKQELAQRFGVDQLKALHWTMEQIESPKQNRALTWHGTNPRKSFPPEPSVMSVVVSESNSSSNQPLRPLSPLFTVSFNVESATTPPMLSLLLCSAAVPILALAVLLTSLGLSTTASEVASASEALFKPETAGSLIWTIVVMTTVWGLRRCTRG